MNRFKKFGIVRSLAVIVALAGGVQAIQAGPIEYVTPPGSKAGEDGGFVNASATFTLQDDHHILITITNLFQNPTSDFQTISGLTFNVSDASGNGKLTTTNSGNISTISKGGSYTAGKSDPLKTWTATEKGTSISLTTISDNNSSEMIIGPDSKGLFDPSLKGLYSNAKSSIIQENPFVLGSATFDVFVKGVTSASILSDVTFHFGHDDEEGSVKGQLSKGGSNPSPSFNPSPVPEPSTIVLLGLGTVGLVISSRYSKDSKNCETSK